MNNDDRLEDFTDPQDDTPQERLSTDPVAHIFAQLATAVLMGGGLMLLVITFVKLGVWLWNL